MTQPGMNWVPALKDILGADDDVDHTRITNPAWVQLDTSYWISADRRYNTEGSHQSPWNHWMPGDPAHAGWNRITLYRKRNTDTIENFQLIRGWITFYEGGETGPARQAQMLVAMSNEITSQILSNPFLDPQTLYDAAHLFYEVANWLMNTGQPRVQTLVSEIDQDASGFEGSAADAFVFAMEDINRTMLYLKENITEPDDWIEFLNGSGDAVVTFKTAMVNAWDAFKAYRFYDPNWLVGQIVQSMEQQVDAYDRTVKFPGFFTGGTTTGGYDEVWNFTFPDQGLPGPYDLMQPAAWQQLDTDTKTAWTNELNKLNTASLAATKALMDNFVNTTDKLQRVIPDLYRGTFYVPPPDPTQIPPPGGGDNFGINGGGNNGPGGGGEGGFDTSGLGNGGGGGGGGGSEGGFDTSGLGGGDSGDGSGGGSNFRGGGNSGGNFDPSQFAAGGNNGGGSGGGTSIGGISGGANSGPGFTGGPGGGTSIGGISGGGASGGSGGGAGGGITIPGLGSGGSFTGGGGAGSGSGAGSGQKPPGTGLGSGLGSGAGSGSGSGSNSGSNSGSGSDDGLGTGIGGLGEGVGSGGWSGIPGLDDPTLGGSFPPSSQFPTEIDPGSFGSGGANPTAGSVVGPLGTPPPGYAGAGALTGIQMGGAGNGFNSGGFGLENLPGAVVQAGLGGANGVVGTGANGMGGVPFIPPMGGMGGMGSPGNGDNGKERERTTWLAEEEEVWGTDPDCAPAVVGRDDSPEYDQSETRRPAPARGPQSPYGPSRGTTRGRG
ncbi:WXG100 family type VII secretion target [Micromonospora sp. NPDC050397]|uniref:WXG100 family type VII secretion target n=1 Tax=Micromonospora sp. NPDC050397 TaxID=3364279 RepID=UPI00384D0FA0